jgi:hypothetical protein
MGTRDGISDRESSSRASGSEWLYTASLPWPEEAATCVEENTLCRLTVVFLLPLPSIYPAVFQTALAPPKKTMKAPKKVHVPF